jgi:hypothetical protein
MLLTLTGLAVLPGAIASATMAAHASGSSAPCTVTIASGPGTVVGSLIVGVTGGATKVMFDCNTSSSAALAVEASLLSGIGTTTVSQAAEADTGNLATFASSATDTGCPAGTAGSCTVATFPVPATFSASDAKAACPSTQAEINEGVFACALAVATAQDVPVTGAEYLMTYASQTTLPNPPTIAATVTSGPPGSTINVSDAAADTGYWWANAIQNSQAVASGATPMLAPPTCAGTGGYGSVPAQFLEVNWFAAGSTAAINGSAAGLTISNDCYDGKAIYAPALSGSIPVPSTLAVGTTYTAYVCELNLTPYPSNDTHASTDCGPAPAGASWIDASFPFTAAAGTAQAPLALTSVSGVQGTSLALATNGGSGTGTLSFAVVNGTATGCAVTSGALSASTSGTCVVTATKAADGTYLGVSSTPTTVTLAALPVLKLDSTRVLLSSNAKTLTLRFSCAGGSCTGTVNVTAHVTVRRKHSTGSVSELINFGTVAYQLAMGSSKSATIHLTASSRSYLEGNPGRPTLNASVYVTDNLGKKHSYLGRVSLLK